VNVLCVTHAYPRSEGDVAGAFIERLVLALRERNHAIHVIAPADRGQGGGESLRGIPVSRVRYASATRETLAYTGTMVEGARSPAGAWAAVNLVRAQAAEITRRSTTMPADVVHAHWWVPGGVSAWWSRGPHKPPYVVTVHGTDVRLLEKSPLVRAVARRVFRGAAAVTAVSSFLAERVAAVAGIDLGDIVVQPMPVEVARFDRTSRGGAGLVSIGRLTKQKNMAVVFRALDHLRRNGLDVPLRLIGDGPERASLEAEAARMQLREYVEFVGAVEPERIPDAVGDADVSVFAATQEGFGLAAAESFMLGIPVVALESGGGVRDVVPRSGAGRIVADDDPAAMAEAIAELLRDDAGRRLAAERGEGLKREFQPATVARKFETIYEHVRTA
jgi:glycosyltransferase involved in cell wall biosynthesis